MTGPCGRLCIWTEINTKTSYIDFLLSRDYCWGLQAGILASPRSTPHTRQLRQVYGSDSDTVVPRLTSDSANEFFG